MKKITFCFNTNNEMTNDKFYDLDLFGFDTDAWDESYSDAWDVAENTHWKEIDQLAEKYHCEIETRYEDSYRYWNGGSAQEIYWEDVEDWFDEDDENDEENEDYQIPEEIVELRDKIEKSFTESVEEDIFDLYCDELDHWLGDINSCKDYDENYQFLLSFGEGLLEYYEAAEEDGRVKKYGNKHPKIEEKIEKLKKKLAEEVK